MDHAAKTGETPIRLIIRIGMTLPIPVLAVRIDRMLAQGGMYALQIGRVFKVGYWDRKKRKQKQ